MRHSPFSCKLLFATLLQVGQWVVVTHPSPAAFLQVAGGVRQAPASTTAYARTAFVATPAPVLRATRERTVLLVRHSFPPVIAGAQETIFSSPIMASYHSLG